MSIHEKPVGLNAGFTLIELMIVVAVVGILAAVALPAYTDYVTRGRIPEATSLLSSQRIRMEQWFQDNRTYVGGPCTSTGQYFGVSCSAGPAAGTYTLAAQGTGAMAGFTFTINETGTRQTTAVQAGWSLPSPNNCWVRAKGGLC